MKIFISYAKEDIEHARKVYSSLSQYVGIEPWLDIEKLRPGDNWQFSISQAIRDSRYIVLLLSTRSINKVGYVQKEIVKILDQLEYYPPSQRYLIPVRIEECYPQHEKISERQFVDLYPDYYGGINKLINSVVDFSEYELAKVKEYAQRLCVHFFIYFPSHLKHLYLYACQLRAEGLLPCKPENYEKVRFKGSDYVVTGNLPMADRVNHLGLIDRFDQVFSRDGEHAYNPYFFYHFGN